VLSPLPTIHRSPVHQSSRRSTWRQIPRLGPELARRCCTKPHEGRWSLLVRHDATRSAPAFTVPWTRRSLACSDRHPSISSPNVARYTTRRAFGSRYAESGLNSRDSAPPGRKGPSTQVTGIASRARQGDGTSMAHPPPSAAVHGRPPRGRGVIVLAPTGLRLHRLATGLLCVGCVALRVSPAAVTKGRPSTLSGGLRTHDVPSPTPESRDRDAQSS
jgi:hypothetical protein